MAPAAKRRIRPKAKNYIRVIARPAMVRRAKARDGRRPSRCRLKPADHTNGAVMNQLNDKFLIDVIAKGGGAVGKSTFMPAWGGASK